LYAFDIFALYLRCVGAVRPAVHDRCGRQSGLKSKSAAVNSSNAAKTYDAEARLIQIYQRIGLAQTRQALTLADQLVADYPHFALAQLVHGDLLSAQTRPIGSMGDMPEATLRAAPGVLGELREESLLRMKALRERPPAGMVPQQFVRLSALNRHAIAIDPSRARLYLFENNANGTKLIADYYMSVGKLGIDKSIEGDLRTPLGVYFVTNTLNPNALKDLYGAGALPINYPNPYDLRRGKTGGGIWLHGVPSNQFARAPKATDGCVALANPDLLKILTTVEVRSTPVVIAPSLQWVNPSAPNPDAQAFDTAWEQWRSTKASGDLARTMAFYTPDFYSYGKNLADWTALVKNDIALARGKAAQIKDHSVLYAPENAQNATMVVTYSEVRAGTTSAPTKRQYWLRSAATQNQWKIFFEGMVS
jgi:murein L,D-transpeptidase YafK